ncbi:MAG: 16S rRNA (guanine(527)-N(7))-methyltransferase RsmG [Alphaproteobacteria bacterium]|nr:16S rRNA (guanine(527)-N(7))-methyltransferase RsmG [Alphaproteobacteria bacterium]
MRSLVADIDGFGPDEVCRLLNVSSDITDRIAAYLDLLFHWNQRINLIGPSEHRHIWRRHVLDCLQLANDFRPGDLRVADIGSGAGLPGIVLALAASGSRRVFLIEKSPRKSEFLAAAVRELSLNAEVVTSRLETLSLSAVDVLTARALAPLSKLLGYAEGLVHGDSLCLFLKGRDVENELTDARESWTFSLSARPSLSSAEGQVLAISSLARRPR